MTVQNPVQSPTKLWETEVTKTMHSWYHRLTLDACLLTVGQRTLRHKIC